MKWAKLQMAVFSLLSAAIAVGGLAFIFISHPAYLHATRDGVPYFAPPVVNPTGGLPLDLTTLVRHFERKDQP